MLMRLDPDLGVGDIRPTPRVTDPEQFGSVGSEPEFSLLRKRFYELLHKKSDPVFV